MASKRRLRLCAAVIGAVVPTVSAGVVAPFATDESGQYLIIAGMRVSANTDVASNNFELGANKAPVPSTGGFLDGGSSGGPTLLGAVPNLPTHAAPVFQGIGGHGNFALVDALGRFELQNIGVYADPDIGIRIAGSDLALNDSGNSFFNDPNHFPNTFDIGTQTGASVNPNDAIQSTRIDSPDNGGFNSGVTFGFDHTALLIELDSARVAINDLSATATLSTGGNGILNTDTTITVAPGLNVIDIDTGGNDFLLNNMNFVIDGPSGASVIFRLPGNENMLISNANVLIGNSGIGMNSVLFFTDQAENDSHFNFDNTIINGAAFWSLGPDGGDINISNAQGCTQLIADIVDLDDVRFGRCSAVVPEPTTLVLLCTGGLLLMRRRV